MALNPALNWLLWALLSCTVVFATRLARRTTVRQWPEGGRDLYADPPDLYFTQRLDHFKASDTRTWQQRYWVRTDLYMVGGPIFLSTAGEWVASSWEMYGNTLEAYAEKLNAMQFVVEHRFYGQSRPTKNMSVENLQYLSSEQALADLAYFISSMNIEQKLPKGSKWITIGCSYGGMLAAWMRSKYPHLVYGAFSCSAPVLAQVDFSAYTDVVVETLGKKCVAEIQAANKEIVRLVKTKEGLTTVVKKFNLCSSINTDYNEVYNLLCRLSSVIDSKVQYNSYITYIEGFQVDVLCDTMTNEKLGTPLDRYSMIRDRLGEDVSHCINSSMDTDFEIIMNITEWNYVDPYDIYHSPCRQWDYQMCTEFGYFGKPEGIDSLMGVKIPKAGITEMCVDIFGKKFNEKFVEESIQSTNVKYGGLNLEASRIITFQGSIDPYHLLGLNKTMNLDSPVILIKGASHCAVYYKENEHDSKALKDARKQIFDIISKWLKNK